jgi:phage terminase small subunit
MGTLANQRMELFALEVFKGSTGKQAAIAAGYSPKAAEGQASRLLRNAKVEARIDELNAELVKRTNRDADAISDILWGIAEDKTQAPVDRIRALTLEARRHREYAERREFSGPSGGPIPLVGALLHGNLSPHQAQLMAELAATLAAREVTSS